MTVTQSSDLSYARGKEGPVSGAGPSASASRLSGLFPVGLRRAIAERAVLEP